MIDDIYNYLLTKYELMDESVRNATLLYTSRLFYFINEIDKMKYLEMQTSKKVWDFISNKEEFLNRFNTYKYIIDLPQNLFIKKSLFAKICFDDILTFIDSVKKISYLLGQTALILPSDRLSHYKFTKYRRAYLYF